MTDQPYQPGASELEPGPITPPPAETAPPLPDGTEPETLQDGPPPDVPLLTAAKPVPLLSPPILRQARDAWFRLGGDLPVLGIELTSMFLPDRTGGVNPMPVLIVMVRGAVLGDANAILTWSALPGWLLSQRDVDQAVGKMCGGARDEKNRQLRAAAPGLNGGRPA